MYTVAKESIILKPGWEGMTATHCTSTFFLQGVLLTSKTTEEGLEGLSFRYGVLIHLGLIGSNSTRDDTALLPFKIDILSSMWFTVAEEGGI